MFAALLIAMGMLAEPPMCLAHRESSHGHHSGGQDGGVQTGSVVIFSAGPVVPGPNYLLGYTPWGVSSPVYPPLMNSSMYGLLGQGPLLPPAGNGFVGNGFVGNGMAGNGADAGNGGFGAPPAPGPGRARVPSNDASRARANQFVNFGDEHFRKQKYNEALERYKDASKSASDLADPYFRQAFALSAMSKYDAAARAIRRGLALDADWPAAEIQLKRLYGDNLLAKATHWEVMAKAATDDPQNADLLFLLAVELYCDGQQDRSRAFFLRAKTLETGDLSHIQVFLRRLDAAAVRPRPAGGQQL
jgi:hypothetical protein